MNALRFLIPLTVGVVFLYRCRPSQGESLSLPVSLPTNTPITTPISSPTSSPTSTPTQTPTVTITQALNDDKYNPPQGVYSCDLYSRQGPGIKLNEYYSSGSFETVQSDDFGNWTSIEFMRISDEFLPIPEDTEERKRYLQFDFRDFMERRIKPDVPQAVILEEGYLQKDTLILLAALDLPGGSNMFANGERMDATRAVYVAIHGAYTYVISSQFTDVFFSDRSREDIVQQLKEELENLYSSCSFEEDPEIGRAFLPPTPTSAPSLTDFIPDVEVPDMLLDPQAGDSNVDGSAVVATQGDWILVQDFRYFFPLPLGWKTEGDNDVYVSFSPDESADIAAIFIRIGLVPGEKTFDDVMDRLEAEFKDAPEFTILERGYVDSGKGYLLLSGDVDLGRRYILYFLAQAVEDPGWYYRWLAWIDPKDWEVYFPVVKAMLQNWADLSLRQLGTALPDDLGK